METKRKKKISNLIMIVLVAVIVICGIMAVGATKGWFGESDSPIVTDTITGAVNIERNGVGYSLEKDIAVKSGDLIETRGGSQAGLRIMEQNLMTLNENTQITAAECGMDSIILEAEQGELFVDMQKPSTDLQIMFGGNQAAVTEAVFSISAQHGSDTLKVFRGQVKVATADKQEKIVKAGKSLSVIEKEDGSLDVEVTDLKASSLNEFLITMAQNCDSKDTLCFTQEQLQKVLDDREAERTAAQNADSTLIAAEDVAKGETDSEAENDSKGSSDNTAAAKALSCTIQIRCDTILKNMDDLEAGKDRYVPSNGIILAASTVEFTEGETVFDVLKRACSYTNIQLEYAYTPLYESYYIEGINNLYEFDCGPESGWMYKVNGWFPNYGCSAYTLKDGDTIVWTYTCNGLGADVGGNVR